MAKYSGALELTWTNKHQALLDREGGGYQWVDPTDHRISEVRLLKDAGTVGEVEPDRQRVKDNLLIRGDALNALTSLIKLPEFAEDARRARTEAAGEIDAWRGTWDRVNASMFVYGADGERLTAEPSRLEADAHRSRVLEALARAGQVVAGPVDELRALTAAAITERAELSPWLTHLTRAVSAVDKAATRWPEPPPFADDSTFEDAIAGLERAVVLREARGENRQRAGERAGREAAAGQGRFHESAYRAR